MFAGQKLSIVNQTANIFYKLWDKQSNHECLHNKLVYRQCLNCNNSFITLEYKGLIKINVQN